MLCPTYCALYHIYYAIYVMAYILYIVPYIVCPICYKLCPMSLLEILLLFVQVTFGYWSSPYVFAVLLFVSGSAQVTHVTCYVQITAVRQACMPISQCSTGVNFCTKAHPIALSSTKCATSLLTYDRRFCLYTQFAFYYKLILSPCSATPR